MNDHALTWWWWWWCVRTKTNMCDRSTGLKSLCPTESYTASVSTQLNAVSWYFNSFEWTLSKIFVCSLVKSFLLDTSHRYPCAWGDHTVCIISLKRSLVLTESQWWTTWILCSVSEWIPACRNGEWRGWKDRGRGGGLQRAGLVGDQMSSQWGRNVEVRMEGTREI